MAVTVDDLAAHLGMTAVPADPEALQRALDSATGIITPHLTGVTPYTPEQQQTLDLATLTVAGDLWRRKDSPGGQYAFSDMSEYPATLPRDPFQSVSSWLTSAGLVNPAVVA